MTIYEPDNAECGDDAAAIERADGGFNELAEPEFEEIEP